MTPAPIASFMASLFQDSHFPEIRLLDAGAGIGSLTSAFVDRVCKQDKIPHGIKATLYELDTLLIEYLSTTIKDCYVACRDAGMAFKASVVQEDFIVDASRCLSGDLLYPNPDRQGYTHAILNPPYKKIRSDSNHRRLLRTVGIETSNLYTGFLALSILLLRPRGELVAIVPRSFCNGPYFKPFRQLMLAHMSLRQIHVFESRTNAFKDDEVLQENIILYAVKEKTDAPVLITSSSGSDFQDIAIVERQKEQVINQNDPHLFIHIATNNLAQHVVDRMALFTHTLDDLGITVSTGPVVDFRLKENLRKNPEDGSVPLIYPGHFCQNFVVWPNGAAKKANAIMRNGETEKWLFPTGTYTLVRRFSSKEEKRRIVAALFDPTLIGGEVVGFENHLNVFHSKRHGLQSEIARGLAVYLNSSLVDAYFRLFNGHTQVNATDLRTLPYPSLNNLVELGRGVSNNKFPNQREIDHLIERTIQSMANLLSTDPIEAQQKIQDALEILKALGFPRAQQNERSAITLLAILALKPSNVWAEASDPLMGITPIMHFCRDHYGREYAPNTRETFRKNTMHQFVNAGLAVPNPDRPNRPINSPKWCYQIEPNALELLRSYSTLDWEAQLDSYLDEVETLRERYAQIREMEMVPVSLRGEKKIKLSAGTHSTLIKAIVEEFAPRFAPGGAVLYLGDTGAKFGHFDEETFRKLGVKFDTHGKMPDVVIYYPQKDWLILVEAVTSGGPVDGKRRDELHQLFSGSKAGLVYVTAFLSRADLKKFLAEISWETEVWVASSPSHLIHFDGTRFLGPYDS